MHTLERTLDLQNIHTPRILLDIDEVLWAPQTTGTSHYHYGSTRPDEDIATLDTPTLWSFSSYNSSPTQLPRHPRIQQTRRHYFGHNSFIRHQNGALLDALERGWRRRRFGSGPSSRRSMDHSVWPHQGAASPIWVNLAMYRVGP
jgi:hypothetical protein